MFSEALLRVLGCMLWGTILVYLFFIRKRSFLHKIPAYTGDPKGNRKTDIALLITAFFLILSTVLPMGAAPAYNGEYPQHRNQYELLARSIANGHIYIDYDDIDPGLEELNNLYDPAERDASGVAYHSDHAYYKGKYYMYFGVVPVILLFLPFYLITGQDLTTYHATQIFAAFAIIGVFLLFRQIAKKYFPKMSSLLLVSLSAAFSFICIYFSIGTPALYCTATSSAVCMEVWSLYFFVKSIYLTAPDERRKQVLLAVAGSLFGALAFGCRPTAALGNLLLIPFCVAFIHNRLASETGKKIGKMIVDIVIIAIPYLVIGILLMLYNYARFENPFEFGQAYQLTGADQSNYGSFLETFSTVRTVNGILNNFIGFTPIIGLFPYAYYNSAFVNFPILLCVFGVFSKTVSDKAAKENLRFLMGMLFFIPLFTTFVQIAWAPGNGTAERYRMDIYYLMTLCAFLVIGLLGEILSEDLRIRLNMILCFLCLAAILMGTIFLLYPDDMNYTAWYPEALERWKLVFLPFFG